MSSGTNKRPRSAAKRPRSAAWRVSLWAALWFAIATLAVFLFLHRSVGSDTQARMDTWVVGEARTMAALAERTPRDARYAAVLRAEEELASREVPDSLYTGNMSDDPPNIRGQNASVFFLETKPNYAPEVWAGPKLQAQVSAAIQRMGAQAHDVFTLPVPDARAPYRVAAVTLKDGRHVYLGLSERDEFLALHSLMLRFLLLWLLNVALGFVIIFAVTRSVLRNVQSITQAASRIDESDLRERVPVSGANDEVAELASTLNHMLDRIQHAVSLLHTITGSLAHDLRSPLTAVRARLEMSMSGEQDGEAIELAIGEIDRVTELLAQSLDTAEAQAGALRMDRVRLDLEALVKAMAELYAPSMAERALRLVMRTHGPLLVWADEGLMHRVLANLFENEMKHLPAGSTVWLSMTREPDRGVLLMEDDGPGFPEELLERLFERGVKGAQSAGHGLGLAFVEAVVAAHGGRVTARNLERGGAQLRLEFVLWEGRDEAPGPRPELVSSQA